MLGLESWDMNWEGLIAAVGSIGVILWFFWTLESEHRKMKKERAGKELAMLMSQIVPIPKMDNEEE